MSPVYDVTHVTGLDRELDSALLKPCSFSSPAEAAAPDADGKTDATRVAAMHAAPHTLTRHPRARREDDAWGSGNSVRGWDWMDCAARAARAGRDPALAAAAKLP